MRLIDADELINQGYEIVVDGWQYDTCNKSIDIDTIPTAYDIDKVVEEIKTLKEEALGEYNMGEYNLDNNIGNSISENYRKDMNEGRCFAYDYAIEIVKQGGVSDDVCEWKQDNMCEKVYRVCGGCFTSAYQKDFKFCPYCGKKIKVVE